MSLTEDDGTQVPRGHLIRVTQPSHRCARAPGRYKVNRTGLVGRVGHRRSLVERRVTEPGSDRPSPVIDASSQRQSTHGASVSTFSSDVLTLARRRTLLARVAPALGDLSRGGRQNL